MYSWSPEISLDSKLVYEMEQDEAWSMEIW
jgi:hypothetical protein